MNLSNHVYITIVQVYKSGLDSTISDYAEKRKMTFFEHTGDFNIEHKQVPKKITDAKSYLLNILKLFFHI